jgi:hypothetical protein
MNTRTTHRQFRPGSAAPRSSYPQAGRTPDPRGRGAPLRDQTKHAHEAHTHAAHPQVLPLKSRRPRTEPAAAAEPAAASQSPPSRRRAGYACCCCPAEGQSPRRGALCRVAEPSAASRSPLPRRGALCRVAEPVTRAAGVARRRGPAVAEPAAASQRSPARRNTRCPLGAHVPTSSHKPRTRRTACGLCDGYRRYAARDPERALHTVRLGRTGHGLVARCAGHASGTEVVRCCCAVLTPSTPNIPTRRSRSAYPRCRRIGGVRVAQPAGHAVDAEAVRQGRTKAVAAHPPGLPYRLRSCRAVP